MTLFVPAIAVLSPTLALFAMYRYTGHCPGTYRWVLVCFVWGAVALGLATYINPAVVHGGLTDHNTMMRVSAPITEESLKALVLVYLACRRKLTHVGEGATFGFAVGIGFAVIENFQYITFDPAATIGVTAMVVRVLSTNLVQASASAGVGMALSWRPTQPTRQTSVILFGVGLMLASGLHAAFNNVVTRVGGSALVVYAVLMGVASAATVLFVVAIMHKQPGAASVVRVMGRAPNGND